jgi:[ribosomal protein S5]-alanine N-acetyltransferase
MQPTLESERLVLRPYRLQDAADVQRLAGDRRIADVTTTVPHPYPDTAAQAWMARHAPAFEAGTAAELAVTLKADGALLGTVSLLELSAQHARAEFGYWMGVPFWGQGYCSEAVQRLLAFAHADLGVTRIVARCLARNLASARVLEKAGLAREGLLVKHTLKNGRYEDVLLYGRLLGLRQDTSACA